MIAFKQADETRNDGDGPINANSLTIFATIDLVSFCPS